MTSQSQFLNEFVDINESVPNHDDLLGMIVDDVHESNSPLDLDDLDEDVSEAKLQISDTRGKWKGIKSTKCWEYFKLISTGHTTNRIT